MLQSVQGFLFGTREKWLIVMEEEVRELLQWAKETSVFSSLFT